MLPLDELAVHEPDARKLIAFLKRWNFPPDPPRGGLFADRSVGCGSGCGNKSGASVFAPLALAEKVDESGMSRGRARRAETSLPIKAHSLPRKRERERTTGQAG